MLIFRFQYEHDLIVFAVDDEVMLCHAIFYKMHLELRCIPKWPVGQIANVDRAAMLLNIPVLGSNHYRAGLPPTRHHLTFVTKVEWHPW